MLRTIIAKRAFNTLKSKNDELINKSLIDRLKSLPKLGEDKRLEPKPKIERHDQYRNLTTKKLNKLILLHLSDPIVWNPSVVSRIFRIPEEHGEHLVEYTKLFTHFNDTKVEEEDEQLFKNPFTVDVARLQNDDKYQLSYKNIAFIDTEKTQSVKISDSNSDNKSISSQEKNAAVSEQ